MNKDFLSRRQFNALCAAVGLSSVPAGAMALSGTSVLAADAPARTAKLRNSAIVPVIGQGSARLGQGRHAETSEEEALRTGISLGMSLIDTSGNYGNGRSEKLIGRAIAGQHDRVFLVSKVEASEVSGDGMARACQASLSRLGTNFLDLCLLHWLSNNYARRGKSKIGACPTLTLTRWKTSSESPTAIAVRPIRSLTASTTEVLSMRH